MTATKTTADQMLEIAQRIAADKTDRRMSTMNGDKRSEVIEWTHKCRVDLANGVIWVWAPQNRVLPKADSQALLNETQKAITLAWDAAGLMPGGRIKVRKLRGSNIHLTGYWHMGVFCTDGRRMGFVVPTLAQECNVSAEVASP